MPRVENVRKRRRTLTQSTLSSSIPRQSWLRFQNGLNLQPWLDRLPREVLREIAGCLMRDDIHNASVSFALTSPHLCDAMKAEVDDGIVLPASSPTCRWDAVLQRSRIDGQWLKKGNGYRYQHFLDVFKRGEWSKAHIRAKVKVTISLVEASLNSVSMESISGDLKVEWFINVVSSKRLRELVIKCCCSDSEHSYGCLVKQVVNYVCVDGPVIHWKVKKLDLDCVVSSRDGYGAVLSKFGHLREVTLHGLPSTDDALTTRLQQLDAVHIHRASKERLFCLTNASGSISSLMFFKSPKKHPSNDLSKDSFRCISTFTRLKALTAFMEPLAELGLALLPSTLRELRLDWRPTENASHGLDSQRHYHRLTPEIIANVVRSCPTLSVLYLCYVSVPFTEVLDVLEATGPRLREFGIPMWHGANAMRKLYTVMELVATCNRNVRIFKLHGSTPKMRRLNGRPNDKANATTPEVLRLRAAFCVLRRRAPWLDLQALQNAVSYLLGVQWRDLMWV